MIQIGILGSNGKMGRWVTQLLESEYSKEAKICASANRNDPLGPLLQADVIIDFSRPEGAIAIADLALQHQGALPSFVFGSTGWHTEHLQTLEKLSLKTHVLVASNFSTGVCLILEILKKYSPMLKHFGYTPVLIEKHHRHKKDAPSGTALSIQKALNPKDPSSVQTHCIRAGEIIGDHEVSFHGPADTIALGHFAQDRSLFARGAIDVALWLAKKKLNQDIPKGMIKMETYFKEVSREFDV